MFSSLWIVREGICLSNNFTNMYLINIKLEVFKKHKLLYYIEMEGTRKPTHTHEYGGPQDCSVYCEDWAKSLSNLVLWRPLPGIVVPLWSLPVVLRWCWHNFPWRATHGGLISLLNIMVLTTMALTITVITSSPSLSIPRAITTPHHHPQHAVFLDHPHPVIDAGQYNQQEINSPLDSCKKGSITHPHPPFFF